MKFVFVGLFVVMLLVFGCTQQQGQPPSATPAPLPGSAPGSSPSSSGSPQPNPGNSFDLTDKNYGQLVALGVPVECTVKIASAEGKQETMKLYMKGKNFRTEIDTTDSPTCKKAVSIFKDSDALYIGCDSQEITPQCTWLKFSTKGVTENTSEPTTTTNAMSSSDLEKVPQTNFNCVTGTFSDSIFVPNGKVCDFSDLTKGYDTSGYEYGNGYGSGSANANSDSSGTSGSSGSDTSSDDSPPLPG